MDLLLRVNSRSPYFRFELILQRYPVPCSAIEDPAISLLLNAPPLLKEKGHTLLMALHADFPNPAGLDGSSTRSTFSSDDDPVDTEKVKITQRAQQWF